MVPLHGHYRYVLRFMVTICECKADCQDLAWWP